MIVGNWTINNSQNALSIDLLNNKVDFEIIEINDRLMSLKNIVSGEILEFERV